MISVWFQLILAQFQLILAGDPLSFNDSWPKNTLFSGRGDLVFCPLHIGGFGKNGRTVGEVARWMYLNGYDLRHFLVSGVTPGVIEMVMRAYLMVRHYSEHSAVEFHLASIPKYRTMLLAAHGIAAAGNVGKIALYQGNPLAINQAEWIALIRYLVPSLKYWLFDRDCLRLEQMETLSTESWNQLLTDSQTILQNVLSDHAAGLVQRRVPSEGRFSSKSANFPSDLRSAEHESGYLAIGVFQCDCNESSKPLQSQLD